MSDVGKTRRLLDSYAILARLKARFPLSYADAVALATAIRFGARLVTGDPEFEATEDLVEVEWI